MILLNLLSSLIVLWLSRFGLDGDEKTEEPYCVSYATSMPVPSSTSPITHAA
jgi:hypothetical protein